MERDSYLIARSVVSNQPTPASRFQLRAPNRPFFDSEKLPKMISVTFNFKFFYFPTGAGAPQLCRRARTPRKRACATLSAF
jgi:hypothetical protein